MSILFMVFMNKMYFTVINAPFPQNISLISR